MFSATLFFPSSMIELMNLVTIVELYFGSGKISRFAATLRLGIISIAQKFPCRTPRVAGRKLLSLFLFGRRGALFRPLGAVFGAPLFAIGDAVRIERAADHVIAHARQIFDAAAADQHDG